MASLPVDSRVAAGRRHCERCSRPLAACICRWIAPLDSRIHLLILHTAKMNMIGLLGLAAANDIVINAVKSLRKHVLALRNGRPACG